MRTDDCEKSWNYANCHYRGYLFDYSKSDSYSQENTYSRYDNLQGYAGENKLAIHDHTQLTSLTFDFSFLSVDNDYIYVS